MSKLNKILTNMPQALTPEEVANLSQTMSAVKTGGGNLHGADGIYATFDTESNRYDIGISGGYNGDLNVNSAEWAQKAKMPGYEYDIAEELHSQAESFTQMGNWLQNVFGTSASTWDLASAVPSKVDESTYTSDSAKWDGAYDAVHDNSATWNESSAAVQFRQNQYTSDPVNTIAENVVVVTSSGEVIDYVTHGLCNGKGTLFFWASPQAPWVPIN